MRWKYVVLVVSTLILVVVLRRVTAVFSTSAQIFGYGNALPWTPLPVSKQPASIAHMEADVYTTSNSRSPILLVHGVNETGKNSPEVKPLAEAFARAGFRVVVPEFVRLTRQNVTPNDIDDVVTAVQWLNQDAGVFCASYGCGPALIAASLPEIRDRIRFVVVFGGYYDLTEQVRHIITKQGDTPLAYSKWRYMAANSDVLSSEDARRQVLALGEERAKHPPDRWKTTASRLSPEARAMVELFESQSEAEFAARLQNVAGLMHRIETLSPSRYIRGIRGRLIIVHIAEDPAIPSSQSLRLAESAKSNRIPHSLTLLNMYGHTRPTWPPFGFHSLSNFYLPEGFKFGRVVHEILGFAG